jgi:HEAT repeat protein
MMDRLTRSSVRAPKAPPTRLVLLIGQSFALGLTLSLLIVAANALFLPAYGSEALPYVYITVAILGSLLFYGYADLERRWSLPALSITTLLILALFYLLSWLALTFTDAGWVPFALMVSFSLVIQMGFVILGGQAGRLFDVRQLKALFPRIVLGFAIGFLVGGFLAAPLATWLSGTENLILATLAGTLLFLAFLLLVDRRYHGALVQAGAPGRRQDAKPMWQLLARRFVLFIVLYQMLAIMASQLLDYMVMDQAAVRFVDSEALTQFFGNYIVAINTSDVLFLALFAGLLLARFGLNFGLMVNPIADGLILLAEVVVVFLMGSDSGLFFGLVVVARLVDITLTDGARRGSINTAYQALPASQRVTVQTGVEFNAISGLTIGHVAIFSLLVTILWIGAANRMYRHYAGALRQSLRRRVLGRTELTLDDKSSLEVVERFLRSGDLPEVRLALDALESSEHDSLARWLIWLAENPDPRQRTEALLRIERLQVAAAAPIVERLAQSEPDPEAKGAAIRALCALQIAGAVELASGYLNDPESEIRLGAAVGLLRYGGIAGVLNAGQWLADLEQSTDPADRRLVAQILDQVEAHNYYQPLLDLLVDPDWSVRCAALTASGHVRHQSLLPLIADNLADPRTRTAASTALVAYGQAALPLAERYLSSSVPEDVAQAGRMARLCGQIGDPQATTLLLTHIGHDDDETRHYVLAALRAAGYRAGPEQTPLIETRLQAEVEQGAQLLAAAADIGPEQEVARLQQALSDDLGRAQKSIFLLLSFLYEPRAMMRAGEQLQSAAGSSRALAMEMLDVTLSGKHKALVLPLVNPDLSMERRLGALDKQFALSRLSRDERLCHLLETSPGSGSLAWQQTAAIFADGRLGHEQTGPLPSQVAYVRRNPFLCG